MTNSSISTFWRCFGVSSNVFFVIFQLSLILARHRKFYQNDEIYLLYILLHNTMHVVNNHILLIDLIFFCICFEIYPQYCNCRDTASCVSKINFITPSLLANLWLPLIYFHYSSIFAFKVSHII
jgi:hypothetical protein